VRITDPQTRLVLQAALLEPQRALAAWHAALELSPIEDWPGTLARPLPRIYLRLRHQPGFSHVDRMRGVYRAAWTSNMVMLSRCAVVIRVLDAHSIPYRVIKGGAVCAMLGSWGARRMGDIDLVVPAVFGEQVEEILRGLAFDPLFVRRRGLTQGPWQDQHGGLLDVHPLTPASDVACMVFGEFGRRLTTDGVVLHVPSAGVSLVLAAGHSVLQVAESDLMQGLLDVASLEPLADPRDVAGSLGTRFQVNAFQSILESLIDLGWTPTQSWTSTIRSARVKTVGIRDLPKRADRARRTARRWASALRNRAVSPLRLRRSQPWLSAHPGYSLWVALGHARPIEAQVVRRRGGFLPLPSGAMKSGDRVTARFGSKPFTDRSVTSWNVEMHDARFALRLHGRDRAWIGLACEDPGINPRVLFINGRLRGWFPVDGHADAEFDVVPVHGRVEFSFRSADGARTRWLESLTITVR